MGTSWLWEIASVQGLCEEDLMKGKIEYLVLSVLIYYYSKIRWLHLHSPHPKKKMIGMAMPYP